MMALSIINLWQVTLKLISVVVNLVWYISGMLLVSVILVTFIGSHLKLLFIKYVWAPGKPMDILSGMDASFQYVAESWFADSTCNSMYCTVVRLRGCMNVTDLRQLMQDRVLNARRPADDSKVFRRIKQRVVRRYGYYVWEEDEDFSIDRHVRLSETCYPDEAALKKLTTEMFTEPLDRNHPAWEVILVPRVCKSPDDDDILENSDGCALIFRTCHSQFDGIGMIQLFALLTDKTEDSKLNDMERTLHLTKASLPPLCKNNPVLRYLANLDKPQSTVKYMEIFCNVVQIITGFPSTVMDMLLHQDKNSMHGPRLSGRKLVGVSERLDLKSFTDIANCCHCAISDVYYSCFVGSLKHCDKSAAIQIRTLITMLLLKPGNVLGENCMTFGNVDLSLKLDNALERLNYISRATELLKQSPGPITSFLIFNLIGNHAPLLFSKFFICNMSYTSTVTNLYGPPFEISVLGHSVTNSFFVPMNLSKAGITVAFLSYNGFVRITVNVDRAVAPDEQFADRLIADFIEEFKRLMASTQTLQMNNK